MTGSVNKICKSVENRLRGEMQRGESDPLMSTLFLTTTQFSVLQSVEYVVLRGMSNLSRNTQHETRKLLVLSAVMCKSIT